MPASGGIALAQSAPPATAQAGTTLPNEDWLTRPAAKPDVGVYYGCHLHVPANAEQNAMANRAEAHGKFRNPKDAKPQDTEHPQKPEDRHLQWCRDAEGEQKVDVLANHDHAVSVTLAETLASHRLLEKTLQLDTQINEKRAAIGDDLKQQVQELRGDVRKEVAAQQRLRTLAIVGWTVAGVFLLSTATIITYEAVK